MAALGQAVTLTGDLAADERTRRAWSAEQGIAPGAPTPEPQHGGGADRHPQKVRW